MAWLQTMRSGKFDLVNPKPAMVDFTVMARVLARTPRFTGHTMRGILSVAQHCREGAYAVLRETNRADWAAAFLLHDGHEYVMGDLATPVRDALCEYAVAETGDLGAGRVVRDAVKAMKSNIDAAIYAAAGIPWPLDTATRMIIKEYDVRMLRTERDARMAPPPEPWEAVYENAERLSLVDTSVWIEEHACSMFWHACRELLPRFSQPVDDAGVTRRHVTCEAFVVAADVTIRRPDPHEERDSFGGNAADDAKRTAALWPVA